MVMDLEVEGWLMRILAGRTRPPNNHIQLQCELIEINIAAFSRRSALPFAGDPYPLDADPFARSANGVAGK
jgi:hypothetical protein